MAKSKTKQIEKKDITVTEKKTASSEIDDIFNTKKIAGKSDDKANDQSTPLTKQQKKKQKKKAAAAAAANERENTQTKDKEDNKEEEVVVEEIEEDQHKVEEVVFAELAAVKKDNKRKAPSKPIVNDDDTFGDSRGKKAKRTTDDGYPLYDVKDLKIGEGKDTPDCPFDCQCCF
ncbi:unnamed protein product [Cunninghamella blakesleeana]